MNFFNRAGIAGKKGPLTYRDSGTLEIRSGGGCLSIFGLPFLLAGLFVMQIPLGLIPMEGSPGPLPSVFVVLFGSVFAAVGAGLVFGRSGIVLDRGMGRVIQWWGLLVPMKRTVYMMDAIRQVEMDFSRGDSDSAATWPVKLSGEGIPKPIAVVAAGELRRGEAGGRGVVTVPAKTPRGQFHGRAGDPRPRAPRRILPGPVASNG